MRTEDRDGEEYTSSRYEYTVRTLTRQVQYATTIIVTFTISFHSIVQDSASSHCPSYNRPATRPKAPIAPAAKTGTAVAGLMALDDDEAAEADAEEAEAALLLALLLALELALCSAEADDEDAEAAAAVMEVDARLSEDASRLEEEASRLAEEV